MVSDSAATQLLVMISDQPRLYARSNPVFTCGGSLVDYFSVGRVSVFGDNYRVNRDCGHRRNQASAG
uniref:Uncharacterized protein n=1 Tax=Populus trichocarpa TaxID=3694 RepID=B9N8Y5_POPTR